MWADRLYWSCHIELSSYLGKPLGKPTNNEIVFNFNHLLRRLQQQQQQKPFNLKEL